LLAGLNQTTKKIVWLFHHWSMQLKAEH